MSDRREALGRLLGIGLAGAGVSAQADASTQGRPKAASPRRPARRLALVLGGGSARGFAHIGVIKALEAHGIKPDAIFGASAGALVGAFWAAGVSATAMETLAYLVRDDEIIDLVTGNAANRRGIVSGHALQTFVNQQLGGRTIESLPTPFRAVATRYPEGGLHIFKQGDVGFAVRASCSLPGVFLPPSLGGQEFLDGGLVSPIPVQAARAEGYDLVVAVDVGGADPGNDRERGGGVYQLLLRSFEIMGEALRRQEGARADILVRPDVSRISSTDFSARRTLVEAGFMAGQRLAPVILERWQRSVL
ncbi:MAG: patatin-like phospholipase family protein [Aquabacterium sp.]